MSRKQLKSNLSLMYDMMADARRFHKGQKTFYVDSALAGTVGYGGRQWASAIPDIGTAFANVTAAHGDRIICAPTHAETRVAVLSVNKSYTAIEGEEFANQRPSFTINAAADCFSLDAAACSISNVHIAAPGTDEATSMFNVTAANCKIFNCTGIGSASSKNFVDCITVASGGDFLRIENVRIRNTNTAVNSFLSLEAAVDSADITGNSFSGACATAGLIDGATATQVRFYNNLVKTIGTNIPAVIWDSNPTGEAFRNHMYGTDATIGNDIQWGSALLIGENFIRGGTGSTVSATNISPALDT